MNVNYTNLFDFRPIPTITVANDYWENGTWKFNMPEITAGTGATPQPIVVTVKGIGAVTLVNAIDDGLLSLSLFGGTEQLPETYIDTVVLSGGCEQRNLPSGYTQVEYLESSGTQYINTGIVLKSKATVTTVGQFSSITPSTNPISMWGFLGTVGGNIPRWGWSVYNNEWLTDLNTTTSRGLANTNKHTFVNETNGTTTYNSFVDGVSIYTQAQGLASVASYQANTLSAYIFARNNSNVAGNFSSARIYNFNIVQDDVLVINLIPCRRNSDSVLGMYDTVSGNFLTNQGSGTFTAGADVVAPSPTTPMDIICNNGVVKVNRNLYSTEYHDEVLSQNNGVTTSPSAGVNVSAMVDCRTIKSFKITTTSPQGSFRIFKYGTDNTFINALSTGNIGDIVTFGDNVGFFRIQYNYTSGNVGTENILIYNSAYNLGIYTDGTQEVVTDSVGNTANAEMLLAVGDYKDTQEVISGAVSRSIGIKVFDGTENWGWSGSFSAFYLNIPNWNLNQNNQSLSSHYKYSTFGVLPDNSFTFYQNSILYIKDSNITGSVNITAFKQFLATQYANGTPVIIVYPKSSATTESATPQVLTKSPVTQTAGSISGLPIAITESSHTVPTPQQPLQINCNNGVIKVSPNLFNADVVLGGTIRSEGIDGDQNPARARLEYLYLPTGTYTISNNGNTVNQCLGASYSNDTGSGFSRIDSWAWHDLPFTFTLTSNRYVRFMVRNSSDIELTTDNIGKFQLEQGSTATPYMPYGQIYTDGTTETVEVHGKNLYNPNQEFELGYIDDNGNLVTSSTLKTTTGYIKVSPSTTYNISYIAEQVSISNFNISLWTDDDIFISRVARHSIQNLGVYSANFTTTSTTAKIKVTIWSNDTIYKDFQLELGSTATTYEPYFNGGQATAENLFKVGTYQDEQSVIDGGVTRNVGIKVLDGTENWSKGTSSMFLNNAINYPNANFTPYCTHYQGILSSSSSITLNSIKLAHVDNNTIRRVYVYPDMTLYSTANDFKQWLASQYNAGTPVIIVYPLAEPTTETVTAQPLTIQEGTNIVQITQASMDNLPLEVSYKAGVAVTITEVENAQLDDNVEVTING